MRTGPAAGADRYDIQSALGALAAVGDVADGQYAITSDGTMKATVSRQLADHVRRVQRISGGIRHDEDAPLLVATMLPIEAGPYQPGGGRLSPRAPLDPVQPPYLLRVLACSK